MKKLFTLALILLVATMGYSQVRKVSKNDAKNNVATMQATKGMESLENSINRPIPPLSEGELDYTIYDYQTNWSNINRTIVWPDGIVNFAYNFASDESFSDRGTGIGAYNAINDEWIPSDGRIEIEKTSFGSIARYQDNSIVVAAQTESTCGLYIVEDKDNITPNSVPAVSYLDPTYEPSCPNVMTSGINRNIIHVVATASFTDTCISVPGADSVNMPIIYFRSMDGGETWDKQNVILPYMGSEYGVYWGQHTCYWMETTEDNCLALVVNNPWSDGMVIYSYDDGETWERKVFYHHPSIYTTFNDWFKYPRWVSPQWGVDGELCMAYEFNCNTGGPDSVSYDLGIGGVAFWSETMPYHGETPPHTPGQPFVMDADYLQDLYDSWNDPSQEIWPEFFGYIDNENPYGQFNIEDFSLHGDYHCGPVAMPVLCKVPNTDDDLIAVWMAIDENFIDFNGNYYFKLFGSYSPNGGLNWLPKIHLTDDFLFDLSEFVYPQAAVVGTTLVVVAQMDNETGTYVQGNNEDPSDNYYQGLTFDISSFIPPVPPPPQPNPEWYYEIVWDDGSITYQHLECAGDTVIGTQRPKIIVRSNTQYDRDEIITEVTHEYVYEQNDIVFWWNKDLGEFTMLYFLNAYAGDEWDIRVGTETLTIHVDAVDYYEYEGTTYRVLQVSDPDDLFSGNIVCGIGHLTSFFPERLMNRDKDYRVDGLRCYWVGGELVFKIGDEDCDAVYSEIHGIEEDGPSTPSTGSGTAGAFTVYPNPANGVLTVSVRLPQCDSPTTGHTEYQISNLMGQTLLQGHISAEAQQIDISTLPAGMYFISVGEQTVKFVVK